MSLCITWMTHASTRPKRKSMMITHGKYCKGYRNWSLLEGRKVPIWSLKSQFPRNFHQLRQDLHGNRAHDQHRGLAYTEVGAGWTAAAGIRQPTNGNRLVWQNSHFGSLRGLSPPHQCSSNSTWQSQSFSRQMPVAVGSPASLLNLTNSEPSDQSTWTMENAPPPNRITTCMAGST